jgi:hypothetical protein
MFNAGNLLTHFFKLFSNRDGENNIRQNTTNEMSPGENIGIIRELSFLKPKLSICFLIT